MSKGLIVGIDWNRIARLHSHVLAHMTEGRGFKSHLGLGFFFRVYVSPRIYIKSCCCYFSVSNLFLVWIFLEVRRPQQPRWPIAITITDYCRHVEMMSTCSREAALFYPNRCVLMYTGLAYFTGKYLKIDWSVKNAVALVNYESCRLLVMGSCHVLSWTLIRVMSLIPAAKLTNNNDASTY